MAALDLSALERCLGAMGTAFRLARLYPSTHPAVQEAMRQLAASLPGVAALGTVDFKVSATGVHWHGQHLLSRNGQLSELAALLFARGVRGLQVHPGTTPDHLIALFGVATGTIQPDDAALGRVAVQSNRRSTQRITSAQLSPPMADRIALTAERHRPSQVSEPRRSGMVFRPEALPADVESRRLVAALLTAASDEGQRIAAGRLAELVPEVLALRDIALVAEILSGLDRALPRMEHQDTAERLGEVGAALTESATVDRLVNRLGESRVPPTERAALVGAVGAVAQLSVPPLLKAYVVAPAELREPFRAAIRVAADRAIEPLQAALGDGNAGIVAAAAHFLGLTGSPDAIPVLTGLLRHGTDLVRESALHALAEIGGKEIARPAVPSLKDESAAVRSAAARVIGVGGDPGAAQVLVRRLEQEEDEGVLASLLLAIGRVDAAESLEVLARYAEPGGLLKRRTPHLRAAAIEGMGYIHRPEARALIELYSHDKEPTVRRAAEEALK